MSASSNERITIDGGTSGGSSGFQSPFGGMASSSAVSAPTTAGAVRTTAIPTAGLAARARAIPGRVRETFEGFFGGAQEEDPRVEFLTDEQIRDLRFGRDMPMLSNEQVRDLRMGPRIMRGGLSGEQHADLRDLGTRGERARVFTGRVDVSALEPSAEDIRRGLTSPAGVREFIERGPQREQSAFERFAPASFVDAREQIMDFRQAGLERERAMAAGFRGELGGFVDDFGVAGRDPLTFAPPTVRSAVQLGGAVRAVDDPRAIQARAQTPQLNLLLGTMPAAGAGGGAARGAAALSRIDPRLIGAGAAAAGGAVAAGQQGIFPRRDVRGLIDPNVGRGLSVGVGDPVPSFGIDPSTGQFVEIPVADPTPPGLRLPVGSLPVTPLQQSLAAAGQVVRERRPAIPIDPMLRDRDLPNIDELLFQREQERSRRTREFDPFRFPFEDVEPSPPFNQPTLPEFDPSRIAQGSFGVGVGSGIGPRLEPFSLVGGAAIPAQQPALTGVQPAILPGQTTGLVTSPALAQVPATAQLLESQMVTGQMLAQQQAQGMGFPTVTRPGFEVGTPTQPGGGQRGGRRLPPFRFPNIEFDRRRRRRLDPRTAAILSRLFEAQPAFPGSTGFTARDPETGRFVSRGGNDGAD